MPATKPLFSCLAILVLALCALAPARAACGRAGVDSDTGLSVVLLQGTLVGDGQIEFYDQETLDRHSAHIHTVTREDHLLLVKIYDYDADAYRTLEFDLAGDSPGQYNSAPHP